MQVRQFDLSRFWKTTPQWGQTKSSSARKGKPACLSASLVRLTWKCVKLDSFSRLWQHGHLVFLEDAIRRGLPPPKDSYQLVWKRKPLLRLYGTQGEAEMSEEKDEAEAIEQEREVEATDGVEPASEAEGETMEEETEEESEEHESEQIEDRTIKTTREKKRKHLEIASASAKSDEARGRAADDGYHAREG